MELTGLQNPLVKETAELKQKKYRQLRQQFLAEGLRTCEDAVACGFAEMLFYQQTEDKRTIKLLEAAAAKNIKLVCVSEQVMKKVADTETPQGIIAVCKMQSTSMEDLLASGKMLLVLDRVGDPGNIGTMLRTADAAGIGGLILLKGCADIYSPKTVRSSMGSLFHLPVLAGIEEGKFVSSTKKAGYQLLVTALDSTAESLYKADLKGRIAFIMGNEANGASDTLLREADKKIYIPMQGRAESLNVAMAAGVVMFEAMRRNL